MKNCLNLPGLAIASILFTSLVSAQDNGGQLLLNGEWQMGYSRKYTSVVSVPGIASDPSKAAEDVLWYKKEVKLPDGNWEAATLELQGARFLPEVFINGEFMGSQKGGMAPLFFNLNCSEVKPGKTITLEIALASLKNVPPTDASYIPVADQWRTNISSCLWDDVLLHFHGEVSIGRIIPFIDFSKQKADIRFQLNSGDSFKGLVKLEVIDDNEMILISKSMPQNGSYGSVGFSYENILKSWTPENPNLYLLRLTVYDRRERITDQSSISFGVKSFEVEKKSFLLNGKPFVPRGTTVVWHRWMRTAEGVRLGYDTAWFVKNIIKRTKDLGGNYLRFHLGLPPERFLDLCDRYGLAVQYEWSFFHGMPASMESLVEQYRSWLDLAMRHPSVSLIHPYNETEGDQLRTVWLALDELLTDYPPLVLEERDVIHIHKYWWSLFENLGLYYDSADQFPKAIMVDEFGGNYLDSKGDMGGHPSVGETFMRFLGRSHTAGERLDFQSMANARVAEYWRRIGAAGFSPFCALGSDQDGNNWFMGPLIEGNPKPVWEALAASFSPQSVSTELWDRNFVPGQKLRIPVYLFNDTDKEDDLQVILTIENKEGQQFYSTGLESGVDPFSRIVKYADVTVPLSEGAYIIKAELANKPESVRHAVISEWAVNVFGASLPGNLAGIKIAVPDNEPELKRLLKRFNIPTVAPGDESAGVILTSLQTWNNIAAGDNGLAETLQDGIMSGRSVVMLDIGERFLGQGYPANTGDLGPLQGVARVSNPRVSTINLFAGISLKFTEKAEPESHLQPDRLNNELWNKLTPEQTRLWNGYRGGLIAPAADMEFIGLSEKAFVGQWLSRGAAEDRIKEGPYYAYELQGFYEFSDKPDDRIIITKLKTKVDLLVQDAPALAIAINPLSPVVMTDLHKGYLESGSGLAKSFIPLASSGKNLTGTPVAMISFGEGKGKLIVSQLLTAGRLSDENNDISLYGIRHDEAAVQFVLNMISYSIN